MRNLLASKAHTNPRRVSLYSLLFLSVLSQFIVMLSNCPHPMVFQAGIFFSGWIAWTYGEYLWHRFIMHAYNKDSALGQPGRHLYHHQHPAELKIKLVQRIMMMLGLLVLVGLSVVLKNYFTLFTGFYFGFMWFCYSHVLLHRKWSMKLFPRLFRYHVHHHCKYPHLCFGVSVPWWDDFFGTVPPKGTVISERILAFYFKEQDHRH